MMPTIPAEWPMYMEMIQKLPMFVSYMYIVVVVSSRLSQVTPFIAIAQLNFIKESTSYIHNTILGISNTTFT